MVLLLLRSPDLARVDDVDDAGGGKDSVVVLLQDLRLKPKMQYYIRCYVGDAGSEFIYRLPAVPFAAIGKVHVSRMADHRPALYTQTSDELCHELLQLADNWNVHRLLWSDPVDSCNLLRHNVESICEEFKGGNRTLQQPVFSAAVRAMMSAGDPMQCEPTGTADASSGDVAELGANDPCDDHGDPDVCPPGDFGADVLDPDEEMLAGMDPSLVEDVALEVIAEHHLDVAVDPPEDPDGLEEAPDDVPALPTIDDYINAAVIQPDGRIMCPLAPYDVLTDTKIGRITWWPANVDPAKQSIAMVCYLHGNCRSPARKSDKITSRQLLRWLFSARLESGCSMARLKELRLEHKETFADL